MILIDSWVCEASGSQLWLYKTNASWLESETQAEIPVKITGRLLEQRATHRIREELHPETYIEKNEFGKPELASHDSYSADENKTVVLPYINYSHTLILESKIPNSSVDFKASAEIQGFTDMLDPKDIPITVPSTKSSTNPLDPELQQHSKAKISSLQKQQDKDCWVLWGTHTSQPIGVDIESLRPQIGKIKSKFCRSEELDFAITPVQTLLIWSAKEAMYKSYGKKEIDFREQMQVHPFSGFSNSADSSVPPKQNSEPETIQFSGELWGDKHYHFDLFARWYEPFVVVWAVESKSAH